MEIREIKEKIRSIWRNYAEEEGIDAILNIPEIKEALERKQPLNEKFGIEVDGKWIPLKDLPTDINELSKVLATHIPAKEEPKPAYEGIEPKQERVEEISYKELENKTRIGEIVVIVDKLNETIRTLNSLSERVRGLEEK